MHVCVCIDVPLVKKYMCLLCLWCVCLCVCSVADGENDVMM